MNTKGSAPEDSSIGQREIPTSGTFLLVENSLKRWLRRSAKATGLAAGILSAILLFGCSDENGDEVRDGSEDGRASRRAPACGEVSGVYRGFYETPFNDRGLAQIKIYSDCEYELAQDIDEDGEFDVGVRDKSVWSSGYLNENGGSKYTLGDGTVITVNGSVVRLSADYAEATMQWVKDIQ
jgi:hypothetical protein